MTSPMAAMGSGRPRVLVVDDDAAYRRIVGQAIGALPEFELAGCAATLAIARRRIEQGDVDAVTIDVVMRGESGLELLAWIRAHHPRLITVLLTAGQSSTACRAVDALLLGASGIVIKPSGRDAAIELQRSLATELSVAVHHSPASGRVHPSLRPAEPDSVFAAPRELIAVGASTGGPPVIMRFLRGLPAQFDVPLVLTQHMPKTHLPYFVDLLAEQSGRRVVAAQHGTSIEPGCTYVATGEGHLVIQRATDRLIVLTDRGPEEHNCKPAVDPMFRSVAQVCGAASVGVLMTGMGSDGALGARALRATGAPVVVQNKETSVVWGMPGAAVALDAADKIVPADQLAQCVIAWTSGLKSMRGK